jgi:hypothetical protein
MHEALMKSSSTRTIEHSDDSIPRVGFKHELLDIIESLLR